MTQEQPRRVEWQPTHAQLFADAVWNASEDELSTTEALVLLAYANHARRKDVAWVAYLRLMQQCKIRSRSTVTRVLRDLVRKGWLELVGPARSHKQSALYRLIIPQETGPTIEPDRTDERTGSPQDRQTGSVSGPDVASDSHSSLDRVGVDETGPMVGQTGSMVDETGSINGAVRTDERSPLSGGPSGNLREGTRTARAGALAGAPSQEDQKRAGNGTSGSAAAKRPVTPAELAAMLHGDQAADQPATPMSAEEAKERMRAMLAGKPSVKVSRWPQARDTTPNPHFNPGALDQLAGVGDSDPT